MQVLLNILLFAALNGFLIGFLLIINRKGNLTANRFYGFLTWSLSAVALENILITSGDIFDFPHVTSVGAIMMILVPPLGYLLFQHLLDSKKKTDTKTLFLHSLPFLLCAISLIPFFLLSPDIKIEIIRNVYYEHQPLRGFSVFYSALNIIQFIIYNILIARKLRQLNAGRAKKNIKFGLSWMSIFLITMNVLVGSYIVVYVSFIYTTDYQSVLILAFVTLLLATVYLTGYQLVKNPFFFNTQEARYERSTLNEDIANDLTERLDDLLINQKPYLSSNVKLADIANELEVNTHQLSQFLNQSKETSFTELINSLRVEHAAKVLQADSEKKQTILAVALDSGFNNQANFIRVFKEAKGSTPSEYRDQES